MVITMVVSGGFTSILDSYRRKRQKAHHFFSRGHLGACDHDNCVWSLWSYGIVKSNVGVQALGLGFRV